MKNSVAVIIGCFQPMTPSIINMIETASRECEHILFCVGSANRSRSHERPFLYTEVSHMIQSVMHYDFKDVDYAVKPLDDHLYNDVAWVSAVNRCVDSFVETLGLEGITLQITIYSNKSMPYYLDLFPYANVREVEEVRPNLTEQMVRHGLYEGTTVPDVLHPMISHYIKEFMKTDTWEWVVSGYDFMKGYRKQFESLRYPITFTTTDSLVYFKGYVLMVRRRSQPGKGQWALPGGFLDQNVTIKDNVIKELKEETNIRVAVPILRSNIRKIDVFDDPNRSLRGRTVTHCGLIILDPVTSLRTLPAVKGGDDGEIAKWFSLNEIEDMKYNIFEDHYFIIRNMLKVS